MRKIKRKLSFLLVLVMLVTAGLPIQAEALATDVMTENDAQIIGSVSSGDEENKEFSVETTEGMEEGISVMSLRPIPEKYAYLVLNGYTDDELSSFPVDSLIRSLQDSDGNIIEISQDATTVWHYVKTSEDGLESYEEYTIGMGEKINLQKPQGATSFELQLIIGKEGQLNPDNERYIIKVYCSDMYSEEFDFACYTESENGNREKIDPINVQVVVSDTEFTDINGNPISGWNYVYQVEEGSYIQPHISMDSALMEHPDISLEVYALEEYLLNQKLGIELYPAITEQLCTRNMDIAGAGYPLTSTGTAQFIVFYYLDGVQFDVVIVNFVMSGKTSEFKGDLVDSTRTSIVDDVLYTFEIESDKEIYNYVLKEGYTANEEYYCSLDAISGINGNVNDQIIKAVEGLYTSLDEAIDQPDIKDALFLDKSIQGGYKANYDGEGVVFTIFFNSGAFGNSDYCHIVIKTTEYTDVMREYTDKPIIGEADPWFRVIGAIDSKGNEYSVENNNIYVVENGKHINMDTYYGYGYQTLFINSEDIDLSELKPIFWYANTDRVYAVSKDTGERVEDNHTRDFSEENQQYTGIIIDNNKENERNYWITFKKLNNSGAELFVYGPNEREVILDEYFEYKHDILIANIGNEPLEGLSVELLDAENVKLDPYWNVGGAGNDVLDPFTATSSDMEYGELSNMAKIRLLPDGDGEVKGILIIKANGQEPVMITLNGTAQNPKIITETLSEAVKYVPYQHIIATDNMHDWVETEFSVSEGALPDGITLNSTTGELYGVPTVPEGSEETTYTFTVEAKYLVEGREGYFDSAYKEFELVIKPNTDENVDAATDLGYEITEPVQNFDQDTILEDSTQTLVSQGEYSQFTDVYLDGQKLTEGQDYTSASGSTRITIYNQTLGTVGTGTHTLGVEFRTEDSVLMRAAQNYTVSSTSDATPPADGEDDSDTPPADDGNDIPPADSGDDDTPPADGGDDNDIPPADGGDDNDTPPVDGGDDNNTPPADSGDGNETDISAGDSGSVNTANNSSQNSGAVQAIAEETEEFIIYTVVRGDSLWKIAARYYGSGSRWRNIYEDNAAIIRSPGLLYAGQQLRIRIFRTESTETPTTAAINTAGIGESSYRVQKGDSLWAIAHKVYGKGNQWNRIYEVNKDVIADPEKIRVGQQLTIPQN